LRLIADREPPQHNRARSSIAHPRVLTMKAKPNISPEQLARLREVDEQLRPLLESEMPVSRQMEAGAQ
jgi:hypothetical protein